MTLDERRLRRCVLAKDLPIEQIGVNQCEFIQSSPPTKRSTIGESVNTQRCSLTLGFLVHFDSCFLDLILIVSFSVLFDRESACRVG
jgi:hypothetical protein